MTGYDVRAKDGQIGRFEDIRVGDEDWSIRCPVVDTRNWWVGEEVMISPRSAGEINWSDKTVDHDIDGQGVMDSPAASAASEMALTDW